MRLIEMANAHKKLTNLPVNLWLDEYGNTRQNKYYLPRIKVQSTKGDRIDKNNLVSVSIPRSELEYPRLLSQIREDQLNSKEWEQVFNFIFKEQEILIKHWKGEIYTDQVLDYFKNIVTKD